MTVQAMAAMAQGAPVEPWAFTLGELGPYDCVLKVKSCGICHSDLHMIDNDWGAARYPLVPGHEVVGEVVEFGAQVTTLKAGDRLGVGWQSGSCHQCDDCLRGNENLCSRSQGLITHGRGGFAEYVRVDARFAFPIPDGIPDHVAGPLLCGGATVYSALRYAGMSGGQRIGVLGVGGLGHMAVQFAARLGNQVTVFTTSSDKAELATQLGASDVVVVPPGESPPRARKRFHILLNTVPHHSDWSAYLQQLDSDGTLSFVGVPLEPAQIPLGLLLGKRRRIMASAIGSPWMIREMLDLADRHGIAPRVETFPLADANAALDRVRSNAVRFRAVLVPG